jgi:hypothetical protein
MLASPAMFGLEKRNAGVPPIQRWRAARFSLVCCLLLFLLDSYGFRVATLRGDRVGREMWAVLAGIMIVMALVAWLRMRRFSASDPGSVTGPPSPRR